MARTWQGSDTTKLPLTYTEQKSEGPEPAIQYSVHRNGSDFRYEIQLPGHSATSMKVETVMGGDRHGLSFLLRVPKLEGIALARAPLVEARYLRYAPENRLVLSPGFPTEKPPTFETALGRVLSPQFEAKCLGCHGQPRVHGTATEKGVSCESCHGPGREHLAAIARKANDKAIQNPAKLPVPQQMESCTQCHSGFSVVEDPLPSDLLISNQVNALKNSECWRQSAGQITCTKCHDPHRDSPTEALIAKSERTCQGCHNTKGAQHAAVCPVNRTRGCVGCHMPEQKKDSFHMADHWIRVHAAQPAPPPAHDVTWRTRIVPNHLYLRMIVTSDRAKADSLRQQLSSGASFFELARDNSTDEATAPAGGFLGDLDANEMDVSWRAAALALLPGQVSNVVEANGGYVLFQRMPRNFRESANTHFQTAMDLRAKNKREEAGAELLEALQIYPRFLRALTWLGVTFGESGEGSRSIAVLKFATQLYPQDAGAHFNLGVAYGAAGNPDEEMNEYKRALEIEPDLVPAYLNLGAALYAARRLEEAGEAYRAGLNANPLIASLHYSLAVVLQDQGKAEESQNEFRIASKIDPKVGNQPAAH